MISPKGGLFFEVDVKHVQSVKCLAGAHAMAERFRAKKRPVLLVKWRFVPDKKGEAGEAKYWWSDGSKTEEKVASHVDAVRLLKSIQDNGGAQGT